jgi:hypothetical protein
MLQVSLGFLLCYLVREAIEVPLKLLETSDIEYTVFTLDASASLFCMRLEIDKDFILKMSLFSVYEPI